MSLICFSFCLYTFQLEYDFWCTVGGVYVESGIIACFEKWTLSIVVKGKDR